MLHKCVCWCHQATCGLNLKKDDGVLYCTYIILKSRFKNK